MSTNANSGHIAAINGLQLYYEIHGKGFPLILLHGGGSTIQSTFGRVLNGLAKNHLVIAIELQAHGHTPDIDRPLSFEQDADDVAALLNYLNLSKANFMGFSNGGTSCLQIAIRHPKLVNKLVLASTTFNRSGMPSEFWEGMKNASFDQMPEPLKQSYLQANLDPKGLYAMFKRDATRMVEFKDISNAGINSISAPSLVLNGDMDVVLTEHALALSRLLPHARLAVLPGGHGDYIGEICSPNINPIMLSLVTEMVTYFLNND